ncbi:hypothetical protein ScPMuIL_010074 [Solemya velum]
MSANSKRRNGSAVRPTSSTEPLAPPPMSPSSVQAMAPPPSYDEVMGHTFMTPIRPDQQDLPVLSYIDIMPRCLNPGNIPMKLAPEFDKFSALLDGANQWLQTNTDMRVWKCETVERKVEKGPDGPFIPMDKMTKHDSMFGFNVWVKGIRLWLTKKLEPNLPVQQLGLLNFTPEPLEIPMSAISIPLGGFATYSPGVVFSHDYLLGRPFGTFSINTYACLQDTIKTINEKLKDSPIQGTILNVETTFMKVCEGFKRKSDLDPEKTCWTEDKSDMRKYTQIIRVFFLKGKSVNEELEMTTFTPDIVSPPRYPNIPPKFETMPFLVDKVARWIVTQQGTKILNIQSQDVRMHTTFLTDEVEIEHDSTDQIESTLATKNWIKVIRVFHTKAPNVPPLQYLTSRLFVPLRIGVRTFETMSQTMYRINAWLNITGLVPCNVETVKYLFNEGNFQGVRTERTDYREEMMSGKIWVFAIRLYFNRMFDEPNPFLLPPTMDWKTQGGGESSCCALL